MPEQEPLYVAEEDPALKGPLMLDPNAKSQAAHAFLESVDAKLSQEAVQRSRNDSIFSDDSQDSTSRRKQKTSVQEADDDMPRLKIKNSVNFGSAWGGDMPGRI